MLLSFARPDRNNFNNEGKLFMLATHQQFLDTWHIENINTGSIRFNKLAKFRWDGRWRDRRYYFYEGMAIEQVDATRMAIWLAPHDYEHRSGGKLYTSYTAVRRI